MSIERHPNIQATGLVVDIIESLRQRLRGDAASLPFEKVLEILEQSIQDFVVDVSTQLDEAIDSKTLV